MKMKKNETNKNNEVNIDLPCVNRKRCTRTGRLNAEHFFSCGFSHIPNVFYYTKENKKTRK